ncbi:2',5'-phosphodiesterase 12 isoform X3 [Bacillus rossius redtenbacheri]|uniref:2',5'-phosphodiesterase 12 isoform X1 n=1 Tax=Bacillus rossius redtenbacheri TaxID=93214 RepID=UPI002FDD5E7F
MLKIFLRSSLNSIYRYTSYAHVIKVSGKMQNVYFRHTDGADHFEVTFHFKDELKGINRAFNFCRQVSEGIDVFLARVGANLERALNKKKKKKKGTIEESEAVEVKVQLLENGKPISRDISCKDVLLNNSNFTLDVLGTSYSIVVNAPWVVSLALPNSIMAGFPVYPSKFRVMFAETRGCGFQWFKNDKGKDTKKVNIEGESWLEVGTGYFYTPLARDIGHKLKVICTPKKSDEQGPPYEVVSSGSVEAGPGLCPFESRHLFTQEYLTAESFRVVSYNILADLYADSEVAHTQLYPYCLPYALDIDYRKQLILKELLGYHSDIICLQEVDSRVFDHDLVPVMGSVGYDGVFHRKGGTVNEGLAVLFRTSRFKLSDSQNVLLSEEVKTNAVFSDIWKRVEGNQVLAERFLARNTCVQCVVLEAGGGERVVVGNTHFYFHPDADHIRLLQGGMAVLYLQDVCTRLCSLPEGKRVSLVFCGDFNSTPDCGVYRLMTTQFVPEDYLDWKSKPEEEVEGLSLSHSLNMQSACGTPDFTNFTAGFQGCLDYIFYQSDQLEVTQVVPLPSLEEVTQHTALPSVVSPSDHLALVADLRWRPV